MKLVTIGDSITKGTFTPRNGAIPDNVADLSFSTLLKERLGADSLVNYGMNGISYCSRTDTLPEYALARQVEALVPGDVTVLAAGTNDFGTGVPLGTAADREDVSFYGAADLVFRRLREKAPEGRFFVVTTTGTPWPRYPGGTALPWWTAGPFPWTPGTPASGRRTCLTASIPGRKGTGFTATGSFPP